LLLSRSPQSTSLTFRVLLFYCNDSTWQYFSSRITIAEKSMEKRPDQEINKVDTWLESNLHSVDEAERLVMDVAKDEGFPEDELHKISMAVRETVVNAVVHGNRYSAHKKVHLRVCTGRDRITVTVEDQGNGFDPSSVPDPLAQENLLHHSGRGILLIKAFVDEYCVRRLSPGGTEVKLVKYRASKL
jgi:serine/threonine-protein kinase RsbW